MNESNSTIVMDSLSENGDRIKVGSRTTIYRLKPSQNWYIDYSNEGRQYRYSLKTKSLKQAKNLALKKDAELILGYADDARAPAPNLRKVIDEYLQDAKRQGVQKGSLSLYKGQLNDFEVFARSKGVIRSDRVTRELVRDFESELETVGLAKLFPVSKGVACRSANAKRTIRNKIKTVKQAIKWAVRNDVLRKDPLFGYKLPKSPKTHATCWSAEEVRAIRQQINSQYLDVFDFLRMTGLRCNEFCWLTKADFDIENRLIHIREKTCPVTGVVWVPKHRRERIVPLAAEAFALAQKALASPGPWLFPARSETQSKSGRLTVGRIRKVIISARNRVNIAKGTTHTLRHVFCSTLANASPPVSPFLVMKIMGHGSLDIVLMYYHSSEAELQKAVCGLTFHLPDAQEGAKDPKLK